MSLFNVTLQRNGRYWKAHWRDAAGRQHGKGLGSVDEVTHRQAGTLARQLEIDLNSGRSIEGGAPDLTHHCDRFLVNRTDLADGTVALYRNTIDRLTRFFGEGRRIDEISRSDAVDWRASLARGELAGEDARIPRPAESTVCRHIREVKTIFRAAVDEDIIPYNPFDRLRSKAPDPDKDWEYVDHSTLHRLVDACRKEGWRMLLALCRLAGLRQGEALRLRWTHVDLQARRLLVENPGRYRTSKKRRREVPIDPELCGLLSQARWKAGTEEDGHVVQGVYADNIWRDFRVIARRAGLDLWARWCHTLRKNCETDWAGRFPIHVVAEWLGNSPEVAMRHYLRAEARHYLEAAGLDGRGEQGDNAANGEQLAPTSQVQVG